MHGSERWRSRSRSELGVAASLAALLGIGCGGAAEPRQPVARIGELVLEAAVVDAIAKRDGLSEDEARTRGLETLRLVAAARAEQVQRGEAPGLTERRADHLRRSARSRLYVSEVFEPEHGPDAIADDDPLLARARADPMMVHPQLHRVCELVIQPSEATDPESMSAQIAEPEWQRAARSALDPVLARVQRHVPVGDHEACKLLQQTIDLNGALEDPSLILKFPPPGGVDLSACAKTDDSGRCIERQFHENWASAVRSTEAPGFSEPFFSPYGLHVVYVDGVMEGRSLADPDTDAFLRQSVLDAWRAQQFDQRLGALSKKRAVRMVRPGEDES